MITDLETIPDSATVAEAAEKLIEGEYYGGVLHMLRPQCRTEEYEAALSYIQSSHPLEDYLSIRFMLACFTLLESGDDNF